MSSTEYPTSRIYQTLENRNNHEEILSHGPYICVRSDAWLSEGYYFWDTFIENAHDWGMMSYKEISKYCIFQGTYYLSNEVCFNLCEPYFLYTFKKVVDRLVEKKIKSKNMLVAEVIDYMRFEAPDAIEFHEKYLAVKAIGFKYHENKDSSLAHLQFKKKYTNDFLNLHPRVQVAIFQEGIKDINDWQICFPEKFVEDNLNSIDKDVKLLNYAPTKDDLERLVDLD